MGNADDRAFEGRFGANWVLGRVLDMMEQRNWTIYRLAKESGISYSSLNNLIIRDNMPTINSLVKICDGLGVSMAEFFAENIPPCDEKSALRTDERQLLKTYNSLSKIDKLRLDAYITGLAKLPSLSSEEQEDSDV